MNSFYFRDGLEMFIFSMGVLLELNDRSKLEQYFINSGNSDIPKNALQGDSIFDYLVNDTGQWGNDQFESND